jgi:hypothetical protein
MTSREKKKRKKEKKGKNISSHQQLTRGEESRGENILPERFRDDDRETILLSEVPDQSS